MWTTQEFKKIARKYGISLKNVKDLFYEQRFSRTTKDAIKSTRQICYLRSFR